MIRLLRVLNNALEIAETEAEFEVSLQAISRDFDYEYFAFLSLGESAISAMSSYPSEWQSRYLTNAYVAVDPILAKAKKTMRPFAWSAANYAFDPDSQIRDFFRQATDFEIRSGLSLPIPTGFGGMAMLTFASHRDSSSGEHEIDPVFAAATIGRIDGQLRRRRSFGAGISLKPEETSCLNWYAQGKTYQDIAAIEKMKYSNVCYHMDKARRKLKVTTSAQAAVVATRLELI